MMMDQRMVRASLLFAVLATSMPCRASTEPGEGEEAKAEKKKAQEAGEPGIELVALWREGLRLESSDGLVRLNPGGRIQIDFAGIDAHSEIQDHVGPLDSGTALRRGRIRMGGTLYNHILFNVMYELAGGDVEPLTTFIGMRVPQLGVFRVGRLLEYHSLEQLSNNNFHTFMERGLPAVFNEYWANGAGIHGSAFSERSSWAFGISRRTDAYGRSFEDSGGNISARLTAAPIHHDDGRSWLHLGGSTVVRRPADDLYRLRSRPESFVAPALLDTGEIASDLVTLGGLELAGALGPVYFQAEWTNAWVGLLETGEQQEGRARLDGFYVTAGYFLTGESRAYDSASGTIGRTRPHRSLLSGEGAIGALEIAARYSELDLTSGGVDGGFMRNGTIGINWYLDPNVRVMGNFVRTYLKGEGRVADIFQMRVQFDL